MKKRPLAKHNIRRAFVQRSYSVRTAFVRRSHSVRTAFAHSFTRSLPHSHSIRVNALSNNYKRIRRIYANAADTSVVRKKVLLLVKGSVTDN